jgi:glycosyltransferase involved in cell wall biosynthesis
MNALPHLVLVSIGYPPIPHVAGFRAHGFATELVKLGHDVTVVTSNLSIPDIISDRTNATADHERSPQVIRAPINPSVEWPSRRYPWTLYRHFAAGPDFAWVDAATAQAAPQLPPGCIVWGTYGGPSVHELARRLAHSCAGAWIADFKDDSSPPARRRLPRLVDSYIMRRRLSSAAAVTTSSQQQADDIRSKFDLSATPIYTGVDTGRWDAAKPLDLGPTLNIVYTGHLTYTMNIGTLIGGFAAARRALADEVRVHYFGTHGRPLQEALDAAGCLDWYVDHGWVSHDDIAQTQRAADLLLYMPLVRSPNVPVKFVEYLASQRPMVSVPEERDAQFRALQEVSPGVTVARTADELSRFLITFAADWRLHGRRPDQPRDVSNFTWGVQASTFVRVLRDVADGMQERSAAHA